MGLRTSLQFGLRFRMSCGLLLAAMGFAALAQAQAMDANPDVKLDVHGEITVNGRQAPYRIRHLPVSSFPELPAAVASELNKRGCLIPQTYEAKRPENVIHASLERAGSGDWAVLCSAQGEVSLLVFFGSGFASGGPVTLAKKQELACLTAQDATGRLGFDWGIDPASPKQVHDAQTGMAHRPPTLDHDCLAESQVDGKTIYHLYRNGSWETVATE
jgi:hypothetical protein